MHFSSAVEIVSVEKVRLTLQPAVEDVEDVEAVKAVEAVEGEHVEILCC